jgi:hypothetical protein
MKPKLQLFKTQENDTKDRMADSDSGAWLSVDMQYTYTHLKD